MKKSRLCALLLCALMLISILPMTALAAPGVAYVDHDITGNTIWPEGTYYICRTEDNREPTVASGATLTISSGSTVYFSDTLEELTSSGGKYPYPKMKVQGTLIANGVTFCAVPGRENSGWHGIDVLSADETKAASVTFTDCTFRHSEFTINATENSMIEGGQTVNVSATGCTFENPYKQTSPDNLPTAVYYWNGHHKAGTGTISLTNSTFSDYARGLCVDGNQRDAIDVSVAGCTFSGITKRPLSIASGRTASVTGCTFNDISSSMECVVEIFTDTYETSAATQTVMVTGNTFNGDASTNKYPVVVGARCEINENVESDTVTFGETFPEAYRYIQLSGSVGSVSSNSTIVEHAAWGIAGVPYLISGSLKVAGSGNRSDGVYSTLTVKPGVIVCFDSTGSTRGLSIDGALTADGTASARIIFRKKPGATDFCEGLKTGGSLGGPISLKYCDFTGLNKGIDISALSTAATAPAIAMENCSITSAAYTTNLIGKSITISDTSFTGPGVNISNGQNVSLTDCAITVNADANNGVYINGGDRVTLTRCDIKSNGTNGLCGINIYNSKAVNLVNCLIASFPKHGVAVSRNYYATADAGAPLIENCTIAKNGLAGVFLTSENWSGASTSYGPIIINSIIAENATAMAEPKLDIICAHSYDFTITDGSISYSHIGRDEAPFSKPTAQSVLQYDHDSFDVNIYPIPAAAYSSRVAGPVYFADAANGNYYLKSATGRWNGSDWVNDDVTSPCINAGDPTSAYTNEPTPNGGRINLGCYGNTAHASKSDDAITSYTITLPDGKVDGYTAYSVIAHGGSVVPVAQGGSYSFTITIGNAFYKSDAFKVKANSIELTPDSDTGVYTIEGITANQVLTVEGVAKIDTPNIEMQPTDQSVAEGSEVTFSVAAEGYNLTYSWQVSKDGGSTWENIEGAAGAEYTIASPALSQNGWQYRCWVKSSAEGGTPYFSRSSNIVTLTVTDSGTRYNISVSSSPSAGGTVSGGGSVNAGASVTVTATANTNYRFVRWTEEDTQVSTNASYTFNATSNRTLVAVFDVNPPYNPPTTPVTKPARVTEIGSGESVTKANIERLISEGETLTVKGEDGAKLVFDTESLKGISEQSSGRIKVDIADVSDEYQQTHAGRQVFSLTVNSGNQVIVDFGGSVTVSLPYVLMEGDKPENVKVWYLAADGSMTEILCTYDALTKQVNFIVSHFSLYVVGIASLQVNPFADVSEADWFYDAVSFAYEKGLMTGTGDNTFSPQAGTTRGMVVTILWRLEGEPETARSMTFTDVREGKWYYKSVAWAADIGIIDGYSADKFGPDDAVTREQMAKILYLYAAYKGYDVSARDDLSALADRPTDWALESVQWAVAASLIQGKSGGLLDPQADTKRCECASILQRFIQKYLEC